MWKPASALGKRSQTKNKVDHQSLQTYLQQSCHRVLSRTCKTQLKCSDLAMVVDCSVLNWVDWVHGESGGLMGHCRYHKQVQVKYQTLTEFLLG